MNLQHRFSSISSRCPIRPWQLLFCLQTTLPSSLATLHIDIDLLSCRLPTLDSPCSIRSSSPTYSLIAWPRKLWLPYLLFMRLQIPSLAPSLAPIHRSRKYGHPCVSSTDHVQQRRKSWSSSSTIYRPRQHH